jgi:hypothetical protein
VALVIILLAARRQVAVGAVCLSIIKHLDSLLSACPWLMKVVEGEGVQGRAGHPTVVLQLKVAWLRLHGVTLLQTRLRRRHGGVKDRNRIHEPLLGVMIFGDCEGRKINLQEQPGNVWPQTLYHRRHPTLPISPTGGQDGRWFYSCHIQFPETRRIMGWQWGVLAARLWCLLTLRQDMHPPA